MCHFRELRKEKGYCRRSESKEWQIWKRAIEPVSVCSWKLLFDVCSSCHPHALCSKKVLCCWAEWHIPCFPGLFWSSSFLALPHPPPPPPTLCPWQGQIQAPVSMPCCGLLSHNQKDGTHHGQWLLSEAAYPGEHTPHQNMMALAWKPFLISTSSQKMLRESSCQASHVQPRWIRHFGSFFCETVYVIKLAWC